MEAIERPLPGVLTDIVSVLVVQETPVSREKSIQDTHATIKGQFGDLGSFKFAVSVTVFDYEVVVLGVHHICKNAVVSGLLDSIVDRSSAVEVDSLGEDQTTGLLIDIGMQDELANIGLVAVTLLDEIITAHAESLYNLLRQRRMGLYDCASTHVTGSIGIRDPNEVSVLPLKYHKTRCWIFDTGVAGVKELDEDKWIDGSAP
jgi:hypothetical protein